MSKYKIAGQVMQLELDSDYIHKNLLSFSCDETNVTDLLLQLEDKKKIEPPDTSPLIYSSYLQVYLINQGYLLLYLSGIGVNACIYDTTLHTGTIYVSEELNLETAYHKSKVVEDTELNLIDFIFFICRDIFFIHMQQKGILAVHSSSLIYKKKAYLFSASSGTGKTTHTNMWVDQYGVEILDGDVTAICLENTEPVAYGLPWCGTSKKFLNRRMELGGIIFLAQSCHNSITSLTPFESIIRLAARCFTPTWTKELVETNIHIAESLTPKILTAYLECLPNLESVDLVKNLIDKH